MRINTFDSPYYFTCLKDYSMKDSNLNIGAWVSIHYSLKCKRLRKKYLSKFTRIKYWLKSRIDWLWYGNKILR